MRKKVIASKILNQSGVTRLMTKMHGQQQLTVLAYHRINDCQAASFDAYAPNVSATVEEFKLQIDYVAENYAVISLDQLAAFVSGDGSLPNNALLITFDDGYLDNYENAFPVLQNYGLPAVIFLMTSRMDSPTLRPWWDEVAYYFHHTKHPQTIELPLLGICSLANINEKTETCDAFMEALKQVSEDEKQTILAGLPTYFDMAPPNDPPMFMSWEQINTLVANGVACQPHTVTHPIMTRVPVEEARKQLVGAKQIIEEKTQQSAIAFAYPNGQLEDYNSEIIDVLKALDYKMAFTLQSGPMRNSDVLLHPFEICRIFIGHRDTHDIFRLKLAGIPRLISQPKFTSRPS